MQDVKFKQKRALRAAVTLAGIAALTACAQIPRHETANARMQQPLAELHLPTNPARQDAAALTLAAEFALQHDDPKTAAAEYAQAAMASDDPQVARRAIDLNLAVRDEVRAGTLIARWQALGAEPHVLAGVRAQLAMLQGHRDEAQRQFAILLASNRLDDWRDFGRALAEARDPALAGAMLESLAQPQRLPSDEKLWVAFSQLGEKLGRQTYAQGLADAAMRRFGGEPSLLWDAQLKMVTGDRAGAKTLLASAMRKNPKDTQLRLGYAALLDAEHDAAGAQRVLALGSQDAQTWGARVAYAARDKDMAQLARLYSQLKRAPASVRDDSAFLLGQLAELLNKDDEALRWYAQVPDDDEHAFDAQARAAVLADKAHRHQQAHDAAQRLQQDYVGDPEHLRRAYQLDAELYARADQYDQAADAYRRGLHALPDDTELQYGLGLAEAEGGKTDVAIADLRRALALNPDDADTMNALGYTLADADRHLDEATRLLTKALAAKPGEPAIMDSWGWLQYRLGHLDVAEKALRGAWEKSRDAEIGVHLGEVLWKRGKQAEARAVFAQVRKLDPTDKELRAAMERLHP
ncbi:MAG: tetratricopeptide repeat protein [Rhodanobacteraceae bacterium]